MSQGINVIIYPVKDIARAKALYRTLLGVEPYVDQPYYVGYKVGDQEIGLDPNGHNKGITGPVVYCEVDDIKTRLQRLLEEGAQAVQEVQDVGGGKLIASARDADGNMLGLMQSP
jgi:predicted enzyme related to lactoylglutathione lyase